MEKQNYLEILESGVWNDIDNFFGDLNNFEPQQIANINIDSSDWIQFTKDNFELAQQKHECPKEHYTEKVNWMCEMNNFLGRDKGNTFELNYGLNGNTNDQLCELLGDQNIKEMGLKKEGLLLRLIVNFPGHGVAWHYDDAGSYRQKFPHAQEHLKYTKRLWFSAIDWHNGHVFQIGKKLLHNWKAGDVYDIPWGIPHASMNFGYNLKFTVAVTGIVNE